MKKGNFVDVDHFHENKNHTLNTVAQFGGNCGATENNLLQKLQNRTTGIITNSCFDADARPLLNTPGLKTIQDLINNEINTMVYQALNGLVPEYLSDLFYILFHIYTRIFIRHYESHFRILYNTSTDLLQKRAKMIFF